MSIQAVVWVIEHSKSRLADRCVLISIANHCDREGKNAWPSVETISHEAKVSLRQVRLSTARLNRAGELGIGKNKGPHGTNLYWFPIMCTGDPALLAAITESKRRGAKSARVQNLQGEGSLLGAQNIVREGEDSALEPSLKSSLEPSPDARSPGNANVNSPPRELGQAGALPEGAVIPKPDPWGLVKKELNATINPQSFDTWILPTRLGYVLDHRIIVRVPTADWEHMREHFAADIRKALKKLGLPYDEFELQPESGNREARHTESKKAPVIAKVNHANSR
jgi:hypothetical protein